MQDPIIKRYTFSMNEQLQTRLTELAKEHKLTQGEVLETLIVMLGKSEEQVRNAMNTRREVKVNGRNSPWAIYQREREAKKAAEQQ